MNPIRVLVIDDNLAVRETLGAYLEDMGQSVRVAASADEARAMLDEAESDVAVVDLRLAGDDGESFILAVHGHHPRLRFLIYTGSTSYDLSKSLVQIGMTGDDILHKPAADLELIRTAIERLASR
jgi:DNA-binding NtrC family response regulator